MDARLFLDVAVERGFVEPVLLLGEQATRAAVRAKIVEMAAVSEPGDLFLLTFSGHGGRTRLPSREAGTWQLYDGTLNDEQLEADLGHFRRGVRVLVVSDNCGGGMPPRSPQLPGGSERAENPLAAPAADIAEPFQAARADSQTEAFQPARANSAADAFQGMRAHSAVEPFQAARRLSAPGRPAIEGLLKASVLVLAACQQGKYADGAGLPGHFAAAIRRTLNHSGFIRTYSAFHQALCREMPAYQQPDYYPLGPANPAFESQPPFTI